MGPPIVSGCGFDTFTFRHYRREGQRRGKRWRSRQHGRRWRIPYIRQR